MAESKEALKSLLKLKEKSEKAGLKLNIRKKKQNTKNTPKTQKPQHSKNDDHGIWSHHFMANRWEKGNSDRFYFLGLQKHCGQ